MGILIVDDSPENLYPLATLLRAAGYSDVRIAHSANAAFRLLGLQERDGGGEHIDVILMDVVMPGLDGIEACRRIKAHEQLRDVPVLMVTARNETTDLEEAFAAGAMDYITKPINPVELLARLRSALALKQEMDSRKARERELLHLAEKLEEANQTLERLSFLDGLTGIANRRYLETYLRREWSRATRGSASLALILIDIDFFKNYNDTYGHQRGDDCLKDLAAALARVLRRPADLLARYGGEEFLAVLPETDTSGACVVADAFRMAVQALGIPHISSAALDRVTISLGVAAATPAADSSPERLLASADAALYEAKRGGRNCVRVASE